MNKVSVLGVNIDNVSLIQATEIVVGWLKDRGKDKHYIVTPNPEFLMLAQTDKRFRKIVCDADLSIPDGSKLSWAASVTSEKTPVKRLLTWLTMLAPTISEHQVLNTTPGVDLMENLIKKSEDLAFTIGLLGGRAGVAEKLQKCLLERYPNLKVVYCSDGGKIDEEGNQKDNISIPPTDILFVAFGHGKQEKWIENNLTNCQVKVMMGVGGAFDYLSGEVPRAPKELRDIGFEWLFRLFIQPWRVKRFISLIKFVFLVLVYQQVVSKSKDYTYRKT